MGQGHITFESVNLNERENLENLGTKGRIALKQMLKKWGFIFRSRSSPLCIGSSGGMTDFITAVSLDI